MDLNRDGKVDARDRAIFHNVVSPTSNSHSPSGNFSGSSFRIKTQEKGLHESKDVDVPKQRSGYSVKDKLISIAMCCISCLFLSGIFSLCECHLFALLSIIGLFLSVTAVLKEW